MPFKRALLQTKQPPLKYGSDCQHFKDFYEAIRNREEESASLTEIFDKKLAKYEKEHKRIQNQIDRLLRARFALEQAGDNK